MYFEGSGSGPGNRHHRGGGASSSASASEQSPLVVNHLPYQVLADEDDEVNDEETI